MAKNRRPAPVLSREVARRFMSRHLRGDGVELGPGHQPCPVPPGVRVRYVDRWRPAENHDHFPELGPAEFPDPDVVANFDVDRLAPLADASCDFVIASHVIEHLAEPLGFLDDIHRVIRPGGAALLLVPDRRRTFDSARAPTSLAHLVAEHAAGVNEVDDEHMLDFLTNAGEGASYLGVPEEPAARARWFAWHRERSIHVHCWSEEEFPDVIVHTIRAMGHSWELVDALATDAQGLESIEFGYVLRRSLHRIPPAQAVDRFLAELQTWRDSGRPVLSRLPVVVPARAVLVVDAPQDMATVDQPFIVGGWAFDEESAAGPGIDAVEVWAVGDDGTEIIVGIGPTGGLRPDVAAAVGERGRTAGYTLSVAGLQTGTCDLIICARSAFQQSFVAVQRRRVTVATRRVDSKSRGDVFSRVARRVRDSVRSRLRRIGTPS